MSRAGTRIRRAFLRGWAGVVAAVGLWATAGAAQQLPGGLGTLALLWAQGDYRGPMICEIAGEPRRALRRITIKTGPRTSTRALDKILFFDLEAPPKTDCYGEAGGEQLNIIGSLNIVFESSERPDTAKHDFEVALRREHGFTYKIMTGALRVGPAGTPIGELKTISFKGGSAEMRIVRRGSDAYRRMAEFGARSLRELVLTTAEGRSFRFELVEWSSRGPG